MLTSCMFAAGMMPIALAAASLTDGKIRSHGADVDKTLWEDPVSFFINPMFLLRCLGFFLVVSVLQSCWADTRYKMLFPMLGVVVQCVVAAVAPGIGEYLVDSAILSGILLWLLAPSVPVLQRFIGDGSFSDSYLGKKGISAQSTEYAALMHYTASISNCAKSGDVARAEQLFSKMAERQLLPNVRHFNSLLDVCGKAGNLERAEMWFEHIRKIGVKPDVITYTSLMSACVKGGKMSTAQKWWDEMIKDEIKPDVVTYSMMMDTCAKAACPQEAEKWLEKMRADGLTPNTVSYNIVIDAYAKDGNAERALFCLENMKDVQPNMVSYNAVIDACAKAGNLSTAEKVLERMIRKGLKPNTITYNSLIDACSKAPDVQRAEYWFGQMSANGFPPDVISFSSMINSCAQCGMAAAAERWLSKMEDQGVKPNVYSFNAAINAQVKAKQLLDPVGWLRRMRDADCRPTVVTYTTLCQPSAKSGDYRTVELLMAMLASDGFQQNHYCLAVRINAFTNSSPPERDLAEKAFRDGIERWRVKVNDTLMRAFVRCVGTERAGIVCHQLGLNPTILHRIAGSSGMSRRSPTSNAILGSLDKMPGRPFRPPATPMGRTNLDSGSKARMNSYVEGTNVDDVGTAF